MPPESEGINHTEAVAEPPTPSIARVAVIAPVPMPLDYSCGDCSPDVGARVLVPFGKTRKVGVVTQLTDQSDHPPERLRGIERVLDPAPLFDAPTFRLLLWAAAYYRAPVGEAIGAALPVRLRGPEQASSPEPGYRLAKDAALEVPGAPRQSAILKLLSRHPGGLFRRAIEADTGPCLAQLRALEAKGLIESCTPSDAGQGPEPQPGPPLNPEQRKVVAEVNAARGFTSFLLEGVTGSGKTEVYIELVKAALARGKQAMILVPEIGLTPQLARRFSERLPVRLAVSHSALAAGERERVWLTAARGEARVVLGTRSTVLMPAPRLGLIIVDEEHDMSLKQQDGFRYSARDLAVRRAQMVGCPVVLGSATPSLETLNNGLRGRYGLLTLPRRAGNARPPQITTLDIRSVQLQAGLSPQLIDALTTQLKNAEQSLLMLNRRGFAPAIICHHCGWVGECRNCDAKLTWHRADARLWCHHCGSSQSVPQTCPECRSDELRPLGTGTERLAERLVELFPQARIARVDRDSTRRKGSLEAVLEQARRGEIAILLGTQMLAKGHDFPGVTLVGVLDIDNGLFGADFRAPERMGQLLVQVAGRAGRGERPGRVLLQTRHPDHPLLRSLLERGYRSFARGLLEERHAAALPPHTHLVVVRAESPDPVVAMGFLREAKAAAAEIEHAGITLWGPAPTSMVRKAGQVRAQLLIQAPERTALRRFMDAWLPLLKKLKQPRALRWAVDVDPLETA